MNLDFVQTDLQTLWILLIWLFVFFRVYSLLWVAKDISRRTSHTGMQILSIIVIVIFTPIIWLPIYFLIRPIQRKDMLLQQEELLDYLESQTIICQACGGVNAYEYEFCVFCGEKIKHVCSWCKKQYAINYLYCPYCAQKSNLTDID